MKTAREELDELSQQIDAEFELILRDRSQLTDERLEAIEDLQDRAHDLREQLDAELPRLVREMTSDKVVMRIFLRQLSPNLSTRDGQTVARLKEIQRCIDQAPADGLSELHEEMTALLNELRQDYERARAARRSRVG